MERDLGCLCQGFYVPTVRFVVEGWCDPWQGRCYHLPACLCQKPSGRMQAWGAHGRACPEPSHAKLTVENVSREVIKCPLALAACEELLRGAGSLAECRGDRGAPALQPHWWSLIIRRSWCKSLPAQRGAGGVRGTRMKVALAGSGRMALYVLLPGLLGLAAAEAASEVLAAVRLLGRISSPALSGCPSCFRLHQGCWTQDGDSSSSLSAR